MNKIEIYKRLYKDYTKKFLPKILLSDPLANFYGLQVGELFEFKKYSKNSGIYIYYRACV